MINGRCLNNPVYADDTVLVVISIENLQELVDRFLETCKNYAMKVNIENKRKILTISKVWNRNYVGGKPIESFEIIKITKLTLNVELVSLCYIFFLCVWSRAMRPSQRLHKKTRML